MTNSVILRSTRLEAIHFIRRLCQTAIVAALLLVTSYSSFAQAKPEVLKVEPPNWWAGHSINPVRVLIRGRNLAGARIEASGNGIRSRLIRINSAGTYVFADLTIDANAAPGQRMLRISTAAGTTEAPFEISTTLNREGRFQG